MKRIGFLACPTTLPGSGVRRDDAFEHDLQITAYEPAFAKHGLSLKVIDWRAPLEAFEGIELVLLGTAWDYQDHAEEFLAKLDALEAAGLLVCNNAATVRWNVEKTYLRALSDAGAATIPTLWVDRVDARGVANAMKHFGADSVVVKRQVGAGALGQHRFSRSSMPDADWVMEQPAMIQPFLPQITQEGELSFIFIDGALSHALVKRAAKGDYRIQSLYGGTEKALEPSVEDTAAARAILANVPGGPPLYARVDMLRGEDDALLLMECELIEPYLYPVQGPKLGENLAAAIAKRVTQK